MLRDRHGEEKYPTWLEHTLEIKDDQDKGSQTGGENHPADPAHPHQVAQSLLHGRAAARGVGTLLRCWTLRDSGGAEEDCRPVNEPDASTADRTTARTCGGGKSLGDTTPTPSLEKMSAPRCMLVSRSVTEEEGKIIPVGKDYWDFKKYTYTD